MNVSSVKNLNGESFSAVQDAALTDFVSSNSASWTGGGSELPESASEALNVVTSNSASWDEISAYIASSASYITSLPADLVYTGDITGKLDTTAIGTAEYDGEFVSVHTINNLPIWSNYSNWADAADRANEAKWDAKGRVLSALPDSATVNSMISSSITGKADTSALTAYAKNWQLGELEDIVDTKLDSTAFSTVSGTFLTAHQDLSGYQTIAGMTAYQVAGDYYSASNPSGFITALPEEEEVEFEEIDLSDYQPVSAMTAYQPVGNYQTAGDYMTTADSANFYTTANESGYLTSLPAGTMNESSFAYDASNNITAYNGSAFKAGDEFPQSATEAIETVTSSSAIWNDTTDAVSSNSGAWGGSALPISAGAGISLSIVDGVLIISTGSN